MPNMRPDGSPRSPYPKDRESTQQIAAQELFERARELHEGKIVDKNLDQAERMYNELLNHNIGAPAVLYPLGLLHMERGNHGLAIAVLEGLVARHPNFAEAWNNLGVAWRHVRLVEQADECFAKAIECLEDSKDQPIYADAYCNRAAAHINRGKPEECLKYAELALQARPDHRKAKWYKALALLEMQRWDTAWEWHEYRFDSGAAGYSIAERNYAADGMTPWWDGKSPGLIVIHGEQGLGDECMFASCIPDMRGENRKFVFEPSPRTHNLFEHSFKKYPDIEVFGTHETDGREWIDRLGRPDFKIALGSLPRFCRRRDEDFHGRPFLIPPPVASQTYAKKLHKLGPRPKIGIAWRGGGGETMAVHLRSVFPNELAPILEQDADFLSLQYTPTASSELEELEIETGLKIHHWPEAVDGRTATGKDIGHLAALVANLDLVISVCQTCIHIAGALGVPCLVLTPSRPSWRYGVTGNMPWYDSVDLIRQEGDDWAACIREAADRLKSFIEERKAT